MSNLKFSAYPLINCLLKRKCIIVLINTIFILCFSKNIAHHFYNNAKNYLNLYYYHPQTKYGQNYGNNKLAWVNNEATKFTYKLLKCFLDYSKEGNGYSFMHINNTANLIDVLNENDENSISADVNNDDFLKNIAIRQKTLLAASNYIQNRLVKKRTLFSLTKSGKKKNKDKKKKKIKLADDDESDYYKKKRKIKRADDDEADYYKKKRKIYIDDDDDDDDYRRKRNIKKHKKKNKKYDDIDDYDYDYDYISDSDDSYEKIKSKKKKTKKTKNDDDDINKDNLKKKKQELEEVNKVAHELEEKKDILENAEKHMVALLTSIHSLEASP